MKIIEGSLDAQDCCFGIVASKFNEFITSQLLASAVETLKANGATEDRIEVIRVPGAFEIPLVARHLARSGRFDAIICVGAIIRGETPHFDYISAEASRGIANAAWETNTPVVFAVLTANTAEQALERASASGQNRGSEAARTAIEMATLMKRLRATSNDKTQGAKKTREG